MKHSNAAIEVETLEKNMKDFLFYCKKMNESATCIRYDNWLDENQKRGKSPVIYKKVGSFAEFRDKIADKLNYHFNLMRRYSDEEIIKAPQECLKEKGNIKYETYESWREDKKKPSCSAIMSRLNTSWSKIRKIYGNLNDDVVTKGYWNKEKCKVELKKHSKIEDMPKSQYYKWSVDQKVPSRGTIRRYFGGWNEMKKEVFDFEDEGISSFCRDCVYTDNCEYDYKLEKCEWVE